MKKFYIACIHTNGEKFWASSMTVTEATNLCYAMSICHAANLCPTKKRSIELMEAWNKTFQENGTYLY